MRNYWLNRLCARIGVSSRGVGGGGDSFPQDDEISLQQLAGDGSVYLDMVYEWQFVQNEWLENQGEATFNNRTDFAPTQHGPIGRGTTTGTIYLNDKPIQCFVHKTDGGFLFSGPESNQALTPSDVLAVDGTFHLDTGELMLFWNARPENYKVIISYEYHYGEEVPLHIRRVRGKMDMGDPRGD